MESQPQNPELSNNLENFHPCIKVSSYTGWMCKHDKKLFKM